MKMTSQSNASRITVKFPNPNPLFDKWLTEWKEEAQKENSKMLYVFSKALTALRAYPLPLETGSDCIILKGFGSKLCEMLNKKLAKHSPGKYIKPVQTKSKPKTPKLKDKPNKKAALNSSQHSLSSPDQTNARKPLQDAQKQKQTHTNKSPKSPKKSKSYLPEKGSGAYAILLTLYNYPQNTSETLTKAEIIEEARLLSNKSFVKADPGTYYTAWSSMKTLITKGLVIRKGQPFKFTLTSDGIEVACKLKKRDESALSPKDTSLDTCEINKYTRTIMTDSDKVCPSTVSVASSQPTNNSRKIPVSYGDDLILVDEILSQASSIAESVTFNPYSFDVILLVDKQETAGAKRNPMHDETIAILTKLGTNFEVRHLKVGDFAWICRERSTQQEMILPYIVERKRMDDLGKSIKDGRFHEQKFRLKQCGIENLMYIVESYGKNTHVGLPLASLVQGAINTLVQDNFQVMFTNNHQASMEKLHRQTLLMKHIYEKKILNSCAKGETKNDLSRDNISLMTFKEFTKNACKARNFKVQEIFIRHLLQLKGMSVEKAKVIVEKYPTPTLLKAEYDRLGKQQGEKLLANIQYGPLKRLVGPVISLAIYQLYNFDKLL